MLKPKRSVAALVVGLVLSVVSCAKRPDAADAKGALTTLEALAAAAPDGGNGLRLRYQACSELPGCAAGCAEDLKFCAGADTEEGQRGAVLGQCFSEVKNAASADAWFQGHFEAFLDASRPLLGAEEQKRFDAARAKAAPRSP